MTISSHWRCWIYSFTFIFKSKACMASTKLYLLYILYIYKINIQSNITNQYLVAYLLSNNIEIALKFQLVCVLPPVYIWNIFTAHIYKKVHIICTFILPKHDVLLHTQKREEREHSQKVICFVILCTRCIISQSAVFQSSPKLYYVLKIYN